jgi:hypothetical protein
MPDWLKDAMSLGASLSSTQIAVRLVVAALFGGCVATIFRFSHGRTKPDSSTLTATLVLLSVLIAMVSMVIGDNVARAFSLVGALSIVRFRTVVEDTRDTAFVIFAVIVGMAAGAGLVLVPLLGIPLVGGIAMILSRSGNSMSDLNESCSLTIRLGLGRDPVIAFGGIFTRHLEDVRLVGVETARQGSAIDLRYRANLRSPSTMSALVNELNQVEGVQSVTVQT